MNSPIRRSGYVSPLVHVNQSDPRDPRQPFCGCHDDPWALCPKWEQWGITPEQREAALAREAAIVRESVPAARHTR